MFPRESEASGARAPPAHLGEPRGLQKDEPCGADQVGSGLRMRLSDPWWLLEAEPGGRAETEGAPAPCRHGEIRRGVHPSPAWMGTGLDTRSLPVLTKRQIFLKTMIVVISVQAGGMKYLRHVMPPSPLSTPQTFCHPQRKPCTHPTLAPLLQSLGTSHLPPSL